MTFFTHIPSHYFFPSHFYKQIKLSVYFKKLRTAVEEHRNFRLNDRNLRQYFKLRNYKSDNFYWSFRQICNHTRYKLKQIKIHINKKHDNITRGRGRGPLKRIAVFLRSFLEGDGIGGFPSFPPSSLLTPFCISMKRISLMIKYHFKEELTITKHLCQKLPIS